MVVRHLETKSAFGGDPDRLAAVGLKAFGRIAEAWGLTNAQAAALLDMGERTWSRAKRGEPIRLSRDQLERIRALVGTYKALHLYFSEPLADEWPCLPNGGPPFGGRSPVAFMAEGTVSDLLATRGYVDALRGGL